jgi:hypothetical protein
MRVYVAGAMRGIPEFNFPAFDAAAAKLRGIGFEVVNPAELDRAQGFNEKTDTPTKAFIRKAIARDLAAITECDAIAMLPGWQNSSGAKLEKQLADFLGLEVLDANTGKRVEP